jgi:hypothetical protein
MAAFSQNGSRKKGTWAMVIFPFTRCYASICFSLRTIRLLYLNTVLLDSLVPNLHVQTQHGSLESSFPWKK